MRVDHVAVELPPSNFTRLPSYVEQETVASTEDDDEQLLDLEETEDIDRTSTEPLTSMEELLSMPQQHAVIAVNSWRNPYEPFCTDISQSMYLMECTYFDVIA